MSQKRTLPSTNLRPEDLASLRVLVVDDNSSTARLISDVLRAGGVGQVETAGDGVLAREQLRLWHPHVVFTDWKMPLMDGLELTRSIRRAAVDADDSVPDPYVPIIMVTGQNSERDVEIARLAGVNEFVIKPFTPAALISRIQLVLSRPREFVISASYVGPDRRRRAELTYAGPMRRMGDPDEVIEIVEREATRATMSVELEALRRLISVRGGVDRETLAMTYRVMQHTRFRARQMRDEMIERASDLMVEYADAMGGHEHCDPDVMEIHFDTLRNLLAMGEADVERGQVLVRQLTTAVQKRIARKARAA